MLCKNCDKKIWNSISMLCYQCSRKTLHFDPCIYCGFECLEKPKNCIYLHNKCESFQNKSIIQAESIYQTTCKNCSKNMWNNISMLCYQCARKTLPFDLCIYCGFKCLEKFNDNVYLHYKCRPYYEIKFQKTHTHTSKTKLCSWQNCKNTPEIGEWCLIHYHEATKNF